MITSRSQSHGHGYVRKAGSCFIQLRVMTSSLEATCLSPVAKAGIIWSVGDERKQSYEQFIAERAPLKYEKRGDIANYENRPEPLPYQFLLRQKTV